MEFIVNHNLLNQALADVSKVVSPKTIIPVLSGIKITAEEAGLILVGSNTDLMLEKRVALGDGGEEGGKVIENGSIVLPAKQLSEIVKKLPNEIHIKAYGKSARIQSGDIIIHLNGLEADGYPAMPVLEGCSREIDSEVLLELIRQTVFAVSKSESRPALTGVCMSFEENRISCAATNSHRLAYRETAAAGTAAAGSFIVPGAGLLELAKLLHQEKRSVHIKISENYIQFHTGSFSLYSRLIEGTYPNIAGLFPEEAKTVITLDTKQFLKAAERACLFASNWKNNNVALEIDGEWLKISSGTSENGSIEELQKIEVITGEENVSISLDGRFLMESLRAVEEEKIRILFGGSLRPVVIEPDGNHRYRQLISPVRTY